MDLKYFISIGLFVLYTIFEFFMGAKQNKSSNTAKSGDKNSFLLISCLNSVGLLLSFGIGTTNIGKVDYLFLFFIIGLIFYITGFSIRVISILTLKEQFTYTVTLAKDHVLQTDGIYRLIRHPSYLGQFLIFLGISLFLANWLSILFMIIPILIGYIKRISIEERFMTEEIGPEYVEYKKHTKKLIPYIF